MQQNDQLNKDIKKALAVIFYTGNTNEGLNMDKNIINVNNYLNKENLTQNENLIDQKDSNIESVNFNTEKSLENQFAEAYKKQVGPDHYGRKSEKIMKTAIKNLKTSQVSYGRPGGQQ